MSSNDKSDRIVHPDLYPLVSMSKLERLLGYDRGELLRVANTSERYYRPFDIRHPDDKKWRHIDRPKGQLRAIQDAIQHKLLSKVHFPDTMYGGVRGRSARDNAGLHVGRDVIVALDLRDCFPNTRPPKVYAAWREVFGCSPDLAGLLTRLTTLHFRLPQGAPTSPLLANLTLLPLYRDISSLIEDRGLFFSIFVDDIVVSGSEARAAIGPIIDIIHKHGHAVAPNKKRIMPQGNRQLITGSVVNRELSVGRSYIDETRRMIYNAAVAGQISQRDLLSITGRIKHVGSFCARQGKALGTFYARHIKCVEIFDAGWQERFERRPCELSFAKHR